MRAYNVKLALTKNPIRYFDAIMLILLVIGIVISAKTMFTRPDFTSMDTASKDAFWILVKSAGIFAYTTMFVGGYFVLRLIAKIANAIVGRFKRR